MAITRKLMDDSQPAAPRPSGPPPLRKITRKLMDDSQPANTSGDTSGGSNVTNSMPTWKDLLDVASTFATQQSNTQPTPQVVTVTQPAPTLSDYLKQPAVAIGGGLVLVLVLVLALRN